jgi:hypothetical protein
MYTLAVALSAFLSLLSPNGLSRGGRPMRIDCDHGIVAYRVVAQEGTLVTYAGITHRIDSSGAIELLVDDGAEAIRVGARTYPLPLFGKADAFGVVTVRLPAR